MDISLVKNDQSVNFNSLKNQFFLLMIIQYNNHINFILTLMPILERQGTLVFFTTTIRRKSLKTCKPKVKWWKKGGQGFSFHFQIKVVQHMV